MSQDNAASATTAPLATTTSEGDPFPALVEALIAEEDYLAQQQAARDADPCIVEAKAALARNQQHLADLVAPHDAKIRATEENIARVRGQLLRDWPEPEMNSIAGRTPAGRKWTVTRRTTTTIQVPNAPLAIRYLQKHEILDTLLKEVKLDLPALRKAIALHRATLTVDGATVEVFQLTTTQGIALTKGAP